MRSPVFPIDGGLYRFFYLMYSHGKSPVFSKKRAVAFHCCKLGFKLNLWFVGGEHTG